MRTHRGSVGLVLALTLATTGSGAASAEGEQVTARLEGATLPITKVSAYHCHDLAFPRLTCFRTSAAADRDLTRTVAARNLSSLNFARLFDDVGYEGGSIALSKDYDDLGDLGWNDRASSFKVLNGGSGAFWEHVGPGGSYYSFCCTGSVSNLGSWNDRISAVEGSA